MVRTLLEVLTKRNQTFYKPIDVRSVANNMGKIVSLISIWNIVKQLGKHALVVSFFLWVDSI